MISIDITEDLTAEMYQKVMELYFKLSERWKIL